jgi:hypothetical protein
MKSTSEKLEFEEKSPKKKNQSKPAADFKLPPDVSVFGRRPTFYRPMSYAGYFGGVSSATDLDTDLWTSRPSGMTPASIY